MELAHEQGRIVVGVDGSAGADDALRWAAGEALARQAPLEVVHVWGPLPTGRVAAPTSAVLKVAAEELLAACTREALDLVGPEQGPVVVVPSLRHGDPADQLVEAADGAALLVVGSRGHGALADLVLGSVSGRCADRARCPVVIVPAVVPATAAADGR
jgi:nucleotide-binding universal stress UspA family protein